MITGEAGSGFVVTNTYNEKVFENPKTDHPVDANKTNTAPKTGDAARMELWLCIMSSALSIIFLVSDTNVKIVKSDKDSYF